MKKFLLLAGLILILMTFAHIIWGRENLLNGFTDDQSEMAVIARVVWCQSAGLLILLGIFLIYQAIRGMLNKFFIIFAILLITLNLLIFAGVSLVNNQAQLLLASFPQIVSFGLVIGLLVYTLKVDKQLPLERAEEIEE